MTSSITNHPAANKIFSPPATPATKSQYLTNQLATQATLGTRLSHRYEQLLHAEKYFDVIFRIAGEQVKCHKLILAAASPVFEAMFYGPICEADKIIEILDISPQIFSTLIAYIYKGTVDFELLNLEDTIELYYGAEKYLLNDLIDECLYAITKKLRFANILPALELSVCMNLSSLIEICMTFFTRCCLSDAQFMLYLKTHYCHIQKDVLKRIIATTKGVQPNLLWFVYEWCQQECRELGQEQQHACKELFEDLLMQDNIAIDEQNLLQQQAEQQHVTIERSYFKAARPFVVDWDSAEWKVRLKSARHVSLTGLILHSRLAPASMQCRNMPSEYMENVTIEIRALAGMNNEDEPAYTWQHHVQKQRFKFNTDMLLKWNEGVLLKPDVMYELKLIWPREAFGAEYPCSIMSFKEDGIEFHDIKMFSGSILKGLRFINLV